MVRIGAPATAVAYAKRQKQKLQERLRGEEKCQFSQLPGEDNEEEKNLSTKGEDSSSAVPVCNSVKEQPNISFMERLKGKDSEQPEEESGSILYSFVARDGILLAEALLPPMAPRASTSTPTQSGTSTSSAAAPLEDSCNPSEESLQGGKQLARRFLTQAIPPGWDHTKDAMFQGKLRATRLGVHDGGGSEPSALQFCCAYTRDFPKQQAMKFIEKLVLLSGPLHSAEWAPGSCAHLCGQAGFAGILEQQLAHFSSRDPSVMALRRVHKQVDEVTAILAANVEKLVERGEKLEELEFKTESLKEASTAFKKGARAVKRWHLMNQAKWGIAVGTAVTASVTIPIVVLTAL